MIPHRTTKPDPSAGAFRRIWQYAFYDWTREMPFSKRVLASIGLFLQGYALWAAMTQSLAWPLQWPHGLWLTDTIWLMFLTGGLLLNGLLTSEFVRKTQLETDLSAARRIQETLHPRGPVVIPGYAIASSYTPYRSVGGDYFDIVDLGGGHTLFAMADVSGKGMPAALLAANIQALVRGMAASDARPLSLATRINDHLCRYSPDDRFATAVFVVLDHASGTMAYVNAGHNAPVLVNEDATIPLEPSGVPLGMFAASKYDERTFEMQRGARLLLYTDGLPDSIRGEDPEGRIREVVRTAHGRTLAALSALVDRRLNADDVTMVLVTRV